MKNTDIQQVIISIILVALFMAITGPMPGVQLLLWIILCLLLGCLGYKLLGNW